MRSSAVPLLIGMTSGKLNYCNVGSADNTKLLRRLRSYSYLVLTIKYKKSGIRCPIYFWIEASQPASIA